MADFLRELEQAAQIIMVRYALNLIEKLLKIKVLRMNEFRSMVIYYCDVGCKLLSRKGIEA